MKKYLPHAILSLAILTSIGGALAYKDIYFIETIRMVGPESNNAEKILKIIQVKPGEILFVSVDTIKNRIKKSDLNKTAEVKFSNNRLEIDFGF